MYLHGKGIVHGDIKGGNILISVDGKAVVCDFGLTKPTGAETSSGLHGAGTTRWQSQDLWMENATKTFMSDVYAFGMLIYEVCRVLHRGGHY